MTDLEITRLCAEAFGHSTPHEVHGKMLLANSSIYDPLHDDAQAMALVKKFHIALGWNPGWAAFRQDTKKWIEATYGCETGDRDNLNATICLCVAKMQKGTTQR